MTTPPSSDIMARLSDVPVDVLLEFLECWEWLRRKVDSDRKPAHIELAVDQAPGHEPKVRTVKDLSFRVGRTA